MNISKERAEELEGFINRHAWIAENISYVRDLLAILRDYEAARPLKCPECGDAVEYVKCSTCLYTFPYRAAKEK